MDYLIYISIALGISLLLIIIAYRVTRSAVRVQQNKAEVKESIGRDQQVKNYQSEIYKLNELNNRYLAFMTKVPTIVQRLHSTSKSNEIISSVTQLINDIIPTDKVDIFIFESSDKLLKKMLNFGFVENSPNLENGYLSTCKN